MEGGVSRVRGRVGQHATRQTGKKEWQEMCKTCAEVGNKFFLPRARFDQAEISCHATWDILGIGALIEETKHGDM